VDSRWTQAINNYCERMSDAFWAEPLNALTNIAFVIAGLVAIWLEARRSGRSLGDTLWLAFLLGCGIVALLSQIVGAVWAISTGVAPTALVVVTALCGVSVLAVALTWAPAAYPDPRISWPALWLSANAILVGIGSFLFHTVAEVWAAVADTSPIMLFILGYFVIAMNRYGGLSWPWAVGATVGFLVAMVAVSAGLREVRMMLPDGYGVFFASSSYFPALLALFGVGLWLMRWRGHPAGRELILAAGVFAVSLTMRSADMPLCEQFPTGTHIFWHILNGLLLFMLVRTLIRHGPLPPMRAATA